MPQTAHQREVEARVTALADALARRQGVSRRRFFQTAAGMAAAFVAMNEVYGPLYDVSRAEAADSDMAADRAGSLSGQFIMDTHTPFLRDDTRIQGFLRQRQAVGKAGWNPALGDKPQTIEDLKYNNDFKEIYHDGGGGERPRRDPGEVRRQERVRRHRPALCPDHGGRAPGGRGADGHAREGPRRRSRDLGHRRHLDRLAQWQIEALRRLEIPEDKQKTYGFAPLDPADGPIKTAIFGENVARLYHFKRQAELGGPRDRLAAIKDEYERAGTARGNLRYGYIVRG